MAIDVPLQYTPKNYVLETLPVHLPAANFDDSIDIESIARPIIQSLPSLSAHSLSTEPIWRDVLALTGTLRTIYSADAICDAWLETCATRQARDFAYQPGSGRISRPDKSIGWIHVAFTFNVTASPAAECHGYLALVFGSDGQWKIWTIRTVLEQLVGCSNVDVLPDRSHQNHITNGINGVHENSNKMNGDSHFKSSFDYDVVIAGAGQAGLSTAGRLQALGVNYLVLETHPRVGENWATRYESAKLHTPKDYSQLPFARIFSSEYQEYLDKHDLVRGYKEFIHRFGIDKHISWNTTLTQGQWNGETWTLQILRSGKQETLSCRHVVLAVGSGGQVPLMPNLPGREYFQGQVLHSVDYHSADSWKGKKGIVVGTANTAHDVVSDMVEAGLQTTTMVQRGRTYVLPVEYFKAISDRIYNGKSRMEDVDREQHSQPQAVSRLLAMNSLNRMASQQPQRFDALERAGFKVERYGDIVSLSRSFFSSIFVLLLTNPVVLVFADVSNNSKTRWTLYRRRMLF